MSFGLCRVKEIVRRTVTDIEVGLLIADEDEISNIRRVIKWMRSKSEHIFSPVTLRHLDPG